MTDFYKSLATVNDNEQNNLGLLQQKFNAAIGKGNETQSTMINSYISANASRKACYAECPHYASVMFHEHLIISIVT